MTQGFRGGRRLTRGLLQTRGSRCAEAGFYGEPRMCRGDVKNARSCDRARECYLRILKPSGRNPICRSAGRNSRDAPVSDGCHVASAGSCSRITKLPPLDVVERPGQEAHSPRELFPLHSVCASSSGSTKQHSSDVL